MHLYLAELTGSIRETMREPSRLNPAPWTPNAEAATVVPRLNSSPNLKVKVEIVFPVMRPCFLYSSTEVSNFKKLPV